MLFSNKFIFMKYGGAAVKQNFLSDRWCALIVEMFVAVYFDANRIDTNLNMLI